MTIKLALAKGRLADETLALLERAGVSCPELKEKSRKLVFHDQSGRYEFIMVKPSDVPTYVDYGVADVGVVGKDTLMEEFVATEAAKNEDAAKDLERVEQEIVAEATMSTEYDDALGNEQAAAEDAETAFEFEQAEIAAEQSL